jgi:hypothetical protein
LNPSDFRASGDDKAYVLWQIFREVEKQGDGRGGILGMKLLSNIAPRTMAAPYTHHPVTGSTSADLKTCQ